MANFLNELLKSLETEKNMSTVEDAPLQSTMTEEQKAKILAMAEAPVEQPMPEPMMQEERPKLNMNQPQLLGRIADLGAGESLPDTVNKTTEQLRREAAENRDSTVRNTMIAEGLAKLFGGASQAKSGVAAPPVDVDLSALRNLANQKVKEVDQISADRMGDANSEESKQARMTASRILGRDLPEGISATQIYKLLPTLQARQMNELNRSERLKDRALRREIFDRQEALQKDSQRRLRGNFDKQIIERYTKKAEGSQTYKDAEKTITNSATIKGLLDEALQKGGQALSMLGPRIAKGIAGEVGVLTDQDVVRYVQNPEVAKSLQATFEKAKSGKLIRDDYDNLNRLLIIMEKKAYEKRAEAYDRSAIQMAKNVGGDYEEAREIIDPDYNRSPMGRDIESPDGKKLRWNGTTYVPVK